MISIESDVHTLDHTDKKRIARDYVRRGKHLFRLGKINQQTFRMMVTVSMCYEITTSFEEKSTRKLNRLSTKDTRRFSEQIK